MKKHAIWLMVVIVLITVPGCSEQNTTPQIVATTLPVYELTQMLCQDTPLEVTQLITDSVSCLHDYTLQVSQIRTIEAAETVIISGAGLEDFLDDILPNDNRCIDASVGVPLLQTETHHGHDHEHYADPHIWLSPLNAKAMAANIYTGLCIRYPEYTHQFSQNYDQVEIALDSLYLYGTKQLSHLQCRELITFHDGFSYFADAFDLKILMAVEEESGSEASAQALIQLCCLVNTNSLPAIFTEVNGSVSAAQIIAAENDVSIFTLDLAASGKSYFDAMYNNIDTVKEALE